MKRSRKNSSAQNCESFSGESDKTGSLETKYISLCLQVKNKFPVNNNNNKRGGDQLQTDEEQIPSSSNKTTGASDREGDTS